MPQKTSLKTTSFKKLLLSSKAVLTSILFLCGSFRLASTITCIALAKCISFHVYFHYTREFPRPDSVPNHLCIFRDGLNEWLTEWVREEKGKERRGEKKRWEGRGGRKGGRLEKMKSHKLNRHIELCKKIPYRKEWRYFGKYNLNTLMNKLLAILCSSEKIKQKHSYRHKKAEYTKMTSTTQKHGTISCLGTSHMS